MFKRFGIIFLVIVSLLQAQRSFAARAIPVKTDLPINAQPGPRPVEIIRSARIQTPPPQVTFKDLRGWTLGVEGDGQVTLELSTEQLIWHDRVAKLTYAYGHKKNADSSGTHIDPETGRVLNDSKLTGGTSATICPPKPVIITDEFDTVAFWIYGGWYRIAQSGDKNPPKLYLNLKDSSGLEFQISMGPITSGNWSIENGFLRPEQRAKMRFPVTLESIIFKELDLDGASRMYLDSITFYKQHRGPQHQDFRIDNKTVPTSDDGMLPTPPLKVNASLEQQGNNFVFTATKNAFKVQYTIDPAKGFLNGIYVSYSNGQVFQPMANGTLEANINAEHISLKNGNLIGSKLIGDTVCVQWQDISNPKLVWSGSYKLRGLTLSVDVNCNGGAAQGLRFGSISGLDKIRGVFVPYLVLNRISHLSTKGPLIGCGNGVFISILPDLYNSNFSNLINTPSASKGELSLMTGTDYTPLTNGKCNDLRERILLTVSDEFSDVLPNARNPVSPNREKLAPYMYVHSYCMHQNFFETLKRYGLDNIIAGHHNLYLSETGPGYSSISCRWRTRADLPMMQWQDYRQAIKDLDFMFSTYSYFPNVHPLNEFWCENKIALKSSGEWQKGWWYGNYALKMSDAVGIARSVGQMVKELYPADSTFLDIHSVIGPSAMDFEAGAQGAGMARSLISGNRDAIAETRKWHTTVISEGYHRWLYAGITDMDYASLLHPPELKSSSDLYLLVDFDLLKIHPFEHGMGMSFEPKYFLEEEGSEWKALLADDGKGTAPIGLYKFISASLAYGHMAVVGYDYMPPLPRIIQLYSLMQGPQREYLTDNVSLIEYHDGEKFVSTSQALMENSIENRRVHIRYLRGMDIFVNFNATNNWQVTNEGIEYTLPPYGWVICKPNAILAFSAIMNGKRVDYTQTADYIYFNTGEQYFAQGPVGVKGAVYIKKQVGQARVIPCGSLGKWEKFWHPDLPKDLYDIQLAEIDTDRGCQDLTINTQFLIKNPADKTKVTGKSLDSSEVAIGSEILDQNRLRLKPTANIVDYYLE